MASRLYFYDETGKDINTKWNGCLPTWLGSALATDGKLACNSDAPILRDKWGRFGRVEITARLYHNSAETFLTARMFGLRRLLVKAWTEEGSTWFWLADRPHLEKKAEILAERKRLKAEVMAR